jgi:hypothetical protein
MPTHVTPLPQHATNGRFPGAHYNVPNTAYGRHESLRTALTSTKRVVPFSHSGSIDDLVSLGIVACAIFLIDGAAFKRFMVTDIRWDLALVGLAAAGMIAAFIGITRAFPQRRLPVFSVVGVVMNAALAGLVIILSLIGL